jgi:GTP-binding protein YchF
MKTGIFGLSGSGKTEILLALAGPEALNLNRVMVKVPEPRLIPLAEIFKPKKITYSEIEYQEIKGGGARSLGSKVLNDIRACDCLLAVIDCFSGANDPALQEENIEGDLIISDLAVIEKRLTRIASDKKKDKNLVNPKEEELLIKAKELLEKEVPLRTDEEIKAAQELKGFQFLSAKPILYVYNVDETQMGEFETKKLDQKVKIEICAKLERELREIEDLEEREEFLKAMGIKESALDRVIHATYKLLGLITFLTAGEKEVRAWTIKKGSTAQEAAGAIHSDIQKGFIRAEVLSWEDFEKVRDFKKAKELGLLRLEGKEYIVKDGDIITFRFNV